MADIIEMISLKKSKSETVPNDRVEIGDIFCCTWGYSMCLPFWGKVIAKNGKTMVTIQPLKETIIEGGHNGCWKSMPSDEPSSHEGAYRTRLYEWYDGTVAIHTAYDHYARLWDGHTPLHCDDMD